MKKNNIVKKSVSAAFAGMMAAGMMAAPAFADTAASTGNAANTSGQTAVVKTDTSASTGSAAASSGTSGTTSGTTATGTTGTTTAADNAATVKTSTTTKSYATLSEALAGAAKGDVVTLNKDVTEDVAVPANAELTLDLNGHKITNKAGDTITVPAGAKVTIKGGTIDNVTSGKTPLLNNGTVVVDGTAITRSATKSTVSTGTDGKTTVDETNGYYAVVNHGDMTLKDAKVSADLKYSSLVENGYYDYTKDYVKGTNAEEPTLTIQSGTYAGGKYNVKNDDNGKVAISGGTFSGGYAGTLLDWNKMDVTGGTFSYDGGDNGAVLVRGTMGDHDTGVVNLKGGTYTGKNLVGDAAGSKGTQGLVTISDGNYTGIANIKAGTVKDKDASIAVTGGTFAGNTDLAPFTSSVTGVVKTKNSDGTISISSADGAIAKYEEKLNQAAKDLTDAKTKNDALQKQLKDAQDKLAQAQKSDADSQAAVKAAKAALAKANAYVEKAIKAKSVSAFRVSALKKSHAVKATWKKNTELDGFVIYRSTKKSSGFKKVATVKGGKSSAKTIKGQKKGGRYYFKIRGYKKVGGKTVFTKTSKAVRTVAK